MKNILYILVLLGTVISAGCDSGTEGKQQSAQSTATSTTAAAEKPAAMGGDTSTKLPVSPVPESERPDSIFAVWAPSTSGSTSASCAIGKLWEVMSGAGGIEITNNNDTITIHAEHNNTQRLVAMTIEHNDPGTVENNLGYSTGRIVGDSLLVTTTFAGSSSSVQMHETFTLTKSRSYLKYTQVLIDPEVSELPDVSTKSWEFRPDVKLEPANC